ncbi:sensor histidine kinase [Paraferrimonas sedimenticola]|uniref:histidine kinase n=1 Tax=Paraferrimonas sedimenticola TaxID=375674 RepID=A0AA37RYB4_9GAMM|nr:HAMP domain-containing sensor histidine kinase [Paraferrimonas sedimenticola]GLP97545.1 two-component sensor histidine kinase [Paraferrimonas sedimenticola]
MRQNLRSGIPLSWAEIQSKVRYRLILLTSLPIILTLLSLVVITIYWNVSYTGKQLFMKVKADLAVASNTLNAQQQTQTQQLNALRNSYDFHRYFSALEEGDNSQLTAIAAHLSQQKDRLGLDFVRLLPVDQAAADHYLRQMLELGSLQAPASGLQVLPNDDLRRIDGRLAQRAVIPLLATEKAQRPDLASEQRGLVSRTLLPITDTRGEVSWLLDGGVLINRNETIVDSIRDLVYNSDTLPQQSIGAVTIFLDTVRVATNVPLNFDGTAQAERGRALGSLVSDEVQQQVLREGQPWVDRAFVFDDWFISAYAPIYDIEGDRVGMIYAGFSEAPFIKDYLYNIVELGSILVLVMLVSGYLVYRAATTLLNPIERIHHVVQAVQRGHNVRIGELGLRQQNELSGLAQQFDRMLDQLQERNRQIQQAAEQLEAKVDERTQTLREKTAELERNVKLLNDTRAQMVTNEKLTALGELTAGIAHEINNPTAVILGNMELLKLTLGEKVAPVSEEVDTVIEQVSRISAIIRNLLQYSRPGEFNAPLQRSEVNPIIEQTLTLARHSIQSKRLELVPELDASHTVQINSSQLQQVLINLVVNAAHASDDHSRIWIRSRDWQDEMGAKGVQIEVEDEGCGMSQTTMKRIFDPFFTTRNEGTGLGLSLSFGLIRRIGGLIDVDSQVGRGSKFTINLYSDANEGALAHPYDGLQITLPASDRS